MKNITWFKPALAPVFGMPICAPTSHVTLTQAAKGRVTDVAGYRPGGSHAWSPPHS